MQTDLFVIGGAVGASWGGPVGWAAFIHVPGFRVDQKIVDVNPDIRKQSGDVLPFAAAIQWYHDKYGDLKEHHQVICVSDSQDLVSCGNCLTVRPADDWIYMEWFEKRGYHIQWVWQGREKNAEVFEEAEDARQQFVRQHSPT